MKFPFIKIEKQDLKAQVFQLQQTVASLNIVLADIQSVQDTSTIGNAYKDCDKSIDELVRKYDNKADWGNFQARSIVDVRSAFIIGDGIKINEQDPITKASMLTPSGKYSKELNYVQSFLQANDLDEEGAQDYAKEAELEGRALFKLVPNRETKQIDLQFISYADFKYKVETSPNDYRHYTKVTYKIPGTTLEVTLNEGEFVYKKFAGRINKVNDVTPKTATVLRLLEDLDKALKDFRSINNLFASPTPHFNCDDSTSAEALYKKLKEINWKVGKFIATSGTTFSMVGTDAAAGEALVKEITNLAKMISGTVGVPVHFLGLPDLMSNRSVSTDMFEMIIASTNRERKTWIGLYEELFRRVLQMASDNGFGSFNPEVVSCNLPQVTGEKLKQLSEIWLPLFSAGVVDLDYLLALIPNADPERMKAAAEEHAKKILEELKQQSDPAKSDQPGGAQ